MALEIDVAFEAAAVEHQLARPLDDELACRRRHDTRRAAGEEAQPELGFRRLDAAGQRRLAEVNPLGRTREAAPLGGWRRRCATSA